MPRISRLLILPLLLALAAAPRSVEGGTVAFETIGDRERDVLHRLLDSPHWPFRAFGLLRLDRYAGEEPGGLLRARLTDESWQVRSFAIEVAARMKLTIEDTVFAEEPDGRVMRSALRHGFTLPEDRLSLVARKLMRTKSLDEMLLGIEIAAASDVDHLRREAARRTERIILAMDEPIAISISPRLARIAGLSPPPQNLAAWREWFVAHDERVTLAPPGQRDETAALRAPSAIAAMDETAFTRLIEYLGALQERDLDLVIVMDATASMEPMINEARAGVDSLITFLNDISRTMRLAFVAYRDHDNKPVWEGQAFTDEVETIRDFLFKLRITGGADLPEAVLDGLTACRRLDWKSDAVKQIVLVGDARPHEEDVYRINGLLEEFANAGIILHAAHVPMVINPAFAAHGHPEAVRRRQIEIDDHNVLTDQSFRELAHLGGGEKITLESAPHLVPAIMHFTIEEPWWPAFDEFYEEYLLLCR